jgi:hypothetical protein
MLPSPYAVWQLSMTIVKRGIVVVKIFFSQGDIFSAAEFDHPTAQEPHQSEWRVDQQKVMITG